MSRQSSGHIIERTRQWIQDVVVECNFCPFAAREVQHDTIHFHVDRSFDTAACLAAFVRECHRLDRNVAIETSFLILPNACPDLDDYLGLVEQAEDLLESRGYSGVYQVASFHPAYRFAGAPADDAANFTNRSIYPMLHLLREAAVEKALLRFPHPETIPERNVEFARRQGLAWMQAQRGPDAGCEGEGRPDRK